MKTFFLLFILTFTAFAQLGFQTDSIKVNQVLHIHGKNRVSLFDPLKINSNNELLRAAIANDQIDGFKISQSTFSSKFARQSGIYDLNPIEKSWLSTSLQAEINAGRLPDFFTLDTTASGSLKVKDNSLKWSHVHPLEFFSSKFFLESPLGVFRWTLAQNSITDFELSPGTAIKSINGLQDTVVVAGQGGVDVVVFNDTISVSYSNPENSVNFDHLSIPLQTAFYNVANDSMRYSYSVGQMEPLECIDSSPALLSNYPSTGNTLKAYRFNASDTNNVTVMLSGLGSVVSGTNVNISLIWGNDSFSQGDSVAWRIDGFSLNSQTNTNFIYSNAIQGLFHSATISPTISTFSTQNFNSMLGEGSSTAVLRISRLGGHENDSGDNVYLWGISIRYESPEGEF